MPKPNQSISTVFWQERSIQINLNKPKLQHEETSSSHLSVVIYGFAETSLAKIFSGSLVANASV